MRLSSGPDDPVGSSVPRFSVRQTAALRPATASRTARDQPAFRKSDGRSKSVGRARRWSAGGAGNLMLLIEMEVVARAGIEPATRGFLIRHWLNCIFE
jgi:hypothetical protein